MDALNGFEENVERLEPVASEFPLEPDLHARSSPQNQTRYQYSERSTLSEGVNGAVKYESVETRFMPYTDFLTSNLRTTRCDVECPPNPAQQTSLANVRQTQKRTTRATTAAQLSQLCKQTVRVEKVAITNLLDMNREIYGDQNTRRKSRYADNAYNTIANERIPRHGERGPQWSPVSNGGPRSVRRLNDSDSPIIENRPALISLLSKDEEDSDVNEIIETTRKVRRLSNKFNFHSNNAREKSNLRSNDGSCSDETSAWQEEDEIENIISESNLDTRSNLSKVSIAHDDAFSSVGRKTKHYKANNEEYQSNRSSNISLGGHSFTMSSIGGHQHETLKSSRTSVVNSPVNELQNMDIDADDGEEEHTYIRQISPEVLNDYKRTAIEILLQRKKESEKRLIKERNFNTTNSRCSGNSSKGPTRASSPNSKMSSERKINKRVSVKRMDGISESKSPSRTRKVHDNKSPKRRHSPERSKKKQTILAWRKSISPIIARYQAAREMRRKSLRKAEIESGATPRNAAKDKANSTNVRQSVPVPPSGYPEYTDTEAGRDATPLHSQDACAALKSMGTELNSNQAYRQCKLIQDILKSPSAKATQALGRFYDNADGRNNDAPDSGVQNVELSVADILKKYRLIFTGDNITPATTMSTVTDDYDEHTHNTYSQLSIVSDSSDIFYELKVLGSERDDDGTTLGVGENSRGLNTFKIAAEMSEIPLRSDKVLDLLELKSGQTSHNAGEIAKSEKEVRGSQSDRMSALSNCFNKCVKDEINKGDGQFDSCLLNNEEKDYETTTHLNKSKFTTATTARSCSGRLENSKSEFELLLGRSSGSINYRTLLAERKIDSINQQPRSITPERKTNYQQMPVQQSSELCNETDESESLTRDFSCSSYPDLKVSFARSELFNKVSENTQILPCSVMSESYLRERAVWGAGTSDQISHWASINSKQTNCYESSKSDKYNIERPKSPCKSKHYSDQYKSLNISPQLLSSYRNNRNDFDIENAAVDGKAIDSHSGQISSRMRGETSNPLLMEKRLSPMLSTSDKNTTDWQKYKVTPHCDDDDDDDDDDEAVAAADHDGGDDDVEDEDGDGDDDDDDDDSSSCYELDAQNRLLKFVSTGLSEEVGSSLISSEDGSYEGKEVMRDHRVREMEEVKIKLFESIKEKLLSKQSETHRLKGPRYTKPSKRLCQARKQPPFESRQQSGHLLNKTHSRTKEKDTANPANVPIKEAALTSFINSKVNSLAYDQFTSGLTSKARVNFKATLDTYLSLKATRQNYLGRDKFLQRLSARKTLPRSYSASEIDKKQPEKDDEINKHESFDSTHGIMSQRYLGCSPLSNDSHPCTTTTLESPKWRQNIRCYIDPTYSRSAQNVTGGCATSIDMSFYKRQENDSSEDDSTSGVKNRTVRKTCIMLLEETQKRTQNTSTATPSSEDTQDCNFPEQSTCNRSCTDQAGGLKQTSIHSQQHMDLGYKSKDAITLTRDISEHDVCSNKEITDNTCITGTSEGSSSWSDKQTLNSCIRHIRNAGSSNGRLGYLDGCKRQCFDQTQNVNNEKYCGLQTAKGHDDTPSNNSIPGRIDNYYTIGESVDICQMTLPRGNKGNALCAKTSNMISGSDPSENGDREPSAQSNIFRQSKSDETQNECYATTTVNDLSSFTHKLCGIYFHFKTSQIIAHYLERTRAFRFIFKIPGLEYLDTVAIICIAPSRACKQSWESGSVDCGNSDHLISAHERHLNCEKESINKINLESVCMNHSGYSRELKMATDMAECNLITVTSSRGDSSKRDCCIYDEDLDEDLFSNESSTEESISSRLAPPITWTVSMAEPLLDETENSQDDMSLSDCHGLSGPSTYVCDSHVGVHYGPHLFERLPLSLSEILLRVFFCEPANLVTVLERPVIEEFAIIDEQVGTMGAVGKNYGGFGELQQCHAMQNPDAAVLTEIVDSPDIGSSYMPGEITIPTGNQVFKDLQPAGGTYRDSEQESINMGNVLSRNEHEDCLTTSVSQSNQSSTPRHTSVQSTNSSDFVNNIEHADALKRLHLHDRSEANPLENTSLTKTYTPRFEISAVKGDNEDAVERDSRTSVKLFRADNKLQQLQTIPNDNKEEWCMMCSDEDSLSDTVCDYSSSHQYSDAIISKYTKEGQIVDESHEDIAFVNRNMYQQSIGCRGAFKAGLGDRFINSTHEMDHDSLERNDNDKLESICFRHMDDIQMGHEEYCVASNTSVDGLRSEYLSLVQGKRVSIMEGPTAEQNTLERNLTISNWTSGASGGIRLCSVSPCRSQRFYIDGKYCAEPKSFSKNIQNGSKHHAISNHLESNSMNKKGYTYDGKPKAQTSGTNRLPPRSHIPYAMVSGDLFEDEKQPAATTDCTSGHKIKQNTHLKKQYTGPSRHLDITNYAAKHQKPCTTKMNHDLKCSKGNDEFSGNLRAIKKVALDCEDHNRQCLGNEPLSSPRMFSSDEEKVFQVSNGCMNSFDTDIDRFHDSSFVSSPKYLNFDRMNKKRVKFLRSHSDVRNTSYAPRKSASDPSLSQVNEFHQQDLVTKRKEIFARETPFLNKMRHLIKSEFTYKKVGTSQSLTSCTDWPEADYHNEIPIWQNGTDDHIHAHSPNVNQLPFTCALRRPYIHDESDHPNLKGTDRLVTVDDYVDILEDHSNLSRSSNTDVDVGSMLSEDVEGFSHVNASEFPSHVPGSFRRGHEQDTWSTNHSTRTESGGLHHMMASCLVAALEKVIKKQCSQKMARKHSRRIYKDYKTNQQGLNIKHLNGSGLRPPTHTQRKKDVPRMFVSPQFTSGFDATLAQVSPIPVDMGAEVGVVDIDDGAKLKHDYTIDPFESIALSCSHQSLSHNDLTEESLLHDFSSTSLLQEDYSISRDDDRIDVPKYSFPRPHVMNTMNDSCSFQQHPIVNNKLGGWKTNSLEQPYVQKIPLLSPPKLKAMPENNGFNNSVPVSKSVEESLPPDASRSFMEMHNNYRLSDEKGIRNIKTVISNSSLSQKEPVEIDDLQIKSKENLIEDRMCRRRNSLKCSDAFESHCLINGIHLAKFTKKERDAGISRSEPCICRMSVAHASMCFMNPSLATKAMPSTTNEPKLRTSEKNTWRKYNRNKLDQTSVSTVDEPIDRNNVYGLGLSVQMRTQESFSKQPDIIFRKESSMPLHQEIDKEIVYPKMTNNWTVQDGTYEHMNRTNREQKKSYTLPYQQMINGSINANQDHLVIRNCNQHLKRETPHKKRVTQVTIEPEIALGGRTQQWIVGGPKQQMSDTVHNETKLQVTHEYHETQMARPDLQCIDVIPGKTKTHIAHIPQISSKSPKLEISNESANPEASNAISELKDGHLNSGHQETGMIPKQHMDNTGNDVTPESPEDRGGHTTIYDQQNPEFLEQKVAHDCTEQQMRQRCYKQHVTQQRPEDQHRKEMPELEQVAQCHTRSNVTKEHHFATDECSDKHTMQEKSINQNRQGGQDASQDQIRFESLDEMIQDKSQNHIRHESPDEVIQETSKGQIRQGGPCEMMEKKYHDLIRQGGPGEMIEKNSHDLIRQGGPGEIIEKNSPDLIRQGGPGEMIEKTAHDLISQGGPGEVIPDRSQDQIGQESIDEVKQQENSINQTRLESADEVMPEKSQDQIRHERVDEVIERENSINQIMFGSADEESQDQLSPGELIQETSQDKIIQGSPDEVIPEKFQCQIRQESLDEVIQETSQDQTSYRSPDEVITEKFQDQIRHERLDEVIQEKFQDQIRHGSPDEVIKEKSQCQIGYRNPGEDIKETYEYQIRHECLDEVIEEKSQDQIRHESPDEVIEGTSQLRFGHGSPGEMIRETPQDQIRHVRPDEVIKEMSPDQIRHGSSDEVTKETPGDKIRQGSPDEVIQEKIKHQIRHGSHEEVLQETPQDQIRHKIHDKMIQENFTNQIRHESPDEVIQEKSHDQIRHGSLGEVVFDETFQDHIRHESPDDAIQEKSLDKMMHDLLDEVIQERSIHETKHGNVLQVTDKRSKDPLRHVTAEQVTIEKSCLQIRDHISEQETTHERPKEEMNNECPEKLVTLETSKEEMNNECPEILVTLETSKEEMNNECPEKSVTLEMSRDEMNNRCLEKLVTHDISNDQIIKRCPKLIVTHEISGEEMNNGCLEQNIARELSKHEMNNECPEKHEMSKEEINTECLEQQASSEISGYEIHNGCLEEQVTHGRHGCQLITNETSDQQLTRERDQLRHESIDQKFTPIMSEHQFITGDGQQVMSAHERSEREMPHEMPHDYPEQQVTSNNVEQHIIVTELFKKQNTHENHLEKEIARVGSGKPLNFKEQIEALRTVLLNRSMTIASPESYSPTHSKTGEYCLPTMTEKKPHLQNHQGSTAHQTGQQKVKQNASGKCSSDQTKTMENYKCQVNRIPIESLGRDYCNQSFSTKHLISRTFKQHANHNNSPKRVHKGNTPCQQKIRNPFGDKEHNTNHSKTSQNCSPDSSRFTKSNREPIVVSLNQREKCSIRRKQYPYSRMSLTSDKENIEFNNRLSRLQQPKYRRRGNRMVIERVGYHCRFHPYRLDTPNSHQLFTSSKCSVESGVLASDNLTPNQRIDLRSCQPGQADPLRCEKCLSPQGSLYSPPRRSVFSDSKAISPLMTAHSWFDTPDGERLGVLEKQCKGEPHLTFLNISKRKHDSEQLGNNYNYTNRNTFLRNSGKGEQATNYAVNYRAGRGVKKMEECAYIQSFEEAEAIHHQGSYKTLNDKPLCFDIYQQSHSKIQQTNTRDTNERSRYPVDMDNGPGLDESHLSLKERFACNCTQLGNSDIDHIDMVKMISPGRVWSSHASNRNNVIDISLHRTGSSKTRHKYVGRSHDYTAIRSTKDRGSSKDKENSKYSGSSDRGNSEKVNHDDLRLTSEKSSIGRGSYTHDPRYSSDQSLLSYHNNMSVNEHSPTETRSRKSQKGVGDPSNTKRSVSTNSSLGIEVTVNNQKDLNDPSPTRQHRSFRGRRCLSEQRPRYEGGSGSSRDCSNHDNQIVSGSLHNTVVDKVDSYDDKCQQLPVQVKKGSAMDIVREFLTKKTRPVQIPVDVYHYPSRRTYKHGKVTSSKDQTRTVVISGPLMNLSIPVYHHEGKVHQSKSPSKANSGQEMTGATSEFNETTTIQQKHKQNNDAQLESSALKPHHSPIDMTAIDHQNCANDSPTRKGSRPLSRFKNKMKKVLHLKKR